MTEDAFAELGLSADATDAQVKAAWRRMVSRWHPDRNPNAQALARIQRINQAFEAIRIARQQQGVEGREPARPSDAPDAGPSARPSARPSAGPSAAAPRPDAQPSARDEEEPAAATGPAEPPRAPIRRKLTLTLEEAAAGCIKPLRGRINAICAPCEGKGHRVVDGACKACRGKGTVLQTSAWFGWPSGKAPCVACEGTGITRETCAACEGSGKAAPLNYQVQARIPPGVRDGDLLHVAARGVRRNPAPADIEVHVQIAPHAFFRLEADGGLRCELPVNGYAWMAQRTVQVPTLEGLRPLALRRDERQYRLAGMGFPRRIEGRRGEGRSGHGGSGDAGRQDGLRGDLLVDIVPVFPEAPSADQDILLDQLIATPPGARLQAWQKELRAWERKRGRSAAGE